MKTTLITSLVLLGALVLAIPAAAQPPAPDFNIGVMQFNNNATILGFQVQGPPNCPVTVFAAFGDPFVDPSVAILPVVQSVLDGNGTTTFQAALPPVIATGDVWLAALIYPWNSAPLMAGPVVCEVTGVESLNLNFPPPCTSTHIVYLGYAPGNCRFRLQMKACPGEQVRVRLDGVVVATYTVASSGIVVAANDAFPMPAGTHHLAITVGDENTETVIEDTIVHQPSACP